MDKISIDYKILSKKISLSLRHKPEKYNLVLDENGFVKVNDLLFSLNHFENFEREITINDIKTIMHNSSKQRFEIFGDKIRALYGHSFPQKIKHEKKIAPNVLYHGTSQKVVSSILSEGLKPMKRQYVHLSRTIEMATSVGKRKGKSPLVLMINAKEMQDNNFSFYYGNDDVWLTDFVPAEYIKVIK